MKTIETKTDAGKRSKQFDRMEVKTSKQKRVYIHNGICTLHNIWRAFLCKPSKLKFKLLQYTIIKNVEWGGIARNEDDMS